MKMSEQEPRKLSRNVYKDEKKWYVVEFTNQTVEVAPDCWLIKSDEPKNNEGDQKLSVYWPEKSYQSYQITNFLASRSCPSKFKHRIYKLKRVFWKSGKFLVLKLYL